MKKVQPILYITTLITVSVFFIYTLGFSTEWAFGSSRLGGFYKEAQTFNITLYALILPTIFLVGLTMLFQSHKLELFNPFNIILSLLSSGFMAYVAAYSFIHLPGLREKYHSFFNTDALSATHSINLTKSEHLWMFDIGFVLSAMLIILAILVFSFTIYKLVDVIRHYQALKKYRKVRGSK